MDALDVRDNAMFALDGIRVLELGDYRGEFCGRLLASLGAEVVRVEAPQGSPSRRIGPFLGAAPDAEQSVFWWTYNLGKKSIVLDLEQQPDRATLVRLAGAADVLVDSLGPGGLERLDLGWEALHARHPRLVVISFSDFGLDGPWSAYRANDLVTLATGGQMMVCGYPPGADGRYDTPPIAPQMHHSIHMGGCLGTNDVLAALAWRDATGRGQRVDLSLHAAAASATENILAWYMAGGVVNPRKPQVPEMRSRDGKYVQVLLGLFPGEWERIVELLDAHGMAADLREAKYSDSALRASPATKAHIEQVVRAFIATQDAVPLFHAAQARGVVWAPILEAHESLEDPHFAPRGTFAEVEHAELGRTVTYPGAPWVSRQLGWRTGPRAPRIGEHSETVLREWLGD
jgi:crotonobetainyl-CoA:carnitine CoA-transferase CaiB-like acyl-CoA transferase